jgi:NifU-like protein involved in Fe-S cluster formation
MAYSEKVVDHYENPRNVGTLDKSSTEVGTGLVGAPECGDVMRLQIKVNPVTQVIEDAKFKTFGCGSAIASSSLATEWVKGKTVAEALTISNTDIVKEQPSATGRARTAWLKKPASPSRLTKSTEQRCPILTRFIATGWGAFYQD